MPDVEELKSRARRAEAAGDYRLALDSYQEALERERETTDPDMMDPALRLRVADLQFRLGDPDRALDTYLKASELYARQGLIPNAIAVCNKVLGIYPDHIECHRILAELQLKIGLTADARNSLLRYLEEAAARGRTATAREAGENFLEEEPDQEVAVAVAEMLAGEGREERALEILRTVWEERTGLRQPAGRIEAFARELDPGVDLSEWSPVWPPPRKKRAQPAGGGTPAAKGTRDGGEEAAPAPGGPAPGAEAPSSDEAPASEEAPAGDEAPRTAAAVEEPPVRAGTGEEGPGEPASDVSSAPPPRYNGARSPEIEEPADGGRNGDGPTGAPGGGGAPDRERELRQGLELVEEMLEMAPDQLELHRRRVLYARRLGDLRLLERALVDLGEVLMERGSHRGARFVFEEVREQLNPGSAPASEGLRRLDRLEDGPGERLTGEEADLPASPPGTAASGETGPGETGADRHFRRRLREALSSASRELAWLHAAAESCGSGGSGPVPGTAHELLGRYLLTRGRPDEAVEHLRAALDRSPAEGERPAELLYHLGRAWRQAAEPARARDCFERLAEVDPDFRAAWAVVSPDAG